MPLPAPSAVDQISAALSVASLRHQVIASNIANRDTQSYQRLKLQFDRAMNESYGTPVASSWPVSPASTATVTTDTAVEPVSLEQDLVALSANAAHYEALARVLGRYFSIVGAIASYNRG